MWQNVGDDRLQARESCFRAKQVLIEQAQIHLAVAGYKSDCGACQRGIVPIAVVWNKLDQRAKTPSTPFFVEDDQVKDRDVIHTASCWATGVVIYRCAKQIRSSPRPERNHRLEGKITSRTWHLIKATYVLLLEVEGHQRCRRIGGLLGEVLPRRNRHRYRRSFLAVGTGNTSKANEKGTREKIRMAYRSGSGRTNVD